ncbi:DUF5820 family protein [Halorarius halobius]|uniref:DUF5820 family protein n=1 Tax=Halorarius halobius TaxID=2962671 RepID=UPI0020CEC57A|nr:DUF5820 family protein [Halorarius halobius]
MADGDADDEEFAPGWLVWSDADDKLVVAYRPDVFDGNAFPAPCLPTIYVTQGRRSRRPGTDRDPAPGTPWYVTLFLEPEVERDAEQYPTEAEAREAARELARRFDAGDVDYRALYQVPRETYFEKLDELTGRE